MTRKLYEALQALQKMRAPGVASLLRKHGYLYEAGAVSVVIKAFREQQDRVGDISLCLLEEEE